MAELELDLENALQKINVALDIVLEDKEKRAMILDTKAEVFWKLQKNDDAIITINQSIELDPENSYYLNQKNKYLQSIN
jgi:tetratricopeptide (TPR) repeat protein